MRPVTGTLPIPWSTETEEALAAFQLSMVDCPGLMVVALAEAVMVGGVGLPAATPPHPASTIINADNPTSNAIFVLETTIPIGARRRARETTPRQSGNPFVSLARLETKRIAK